MNLNTTLLCAPSANSYIIVRYKNTYINESIDLGFMKMAMG